MIVNMSAMLLPVVEYSAQVLGWQLDLEEHSRFRQAIIDFTSAVSLILVDYSGTDCCIMDSFGTYAVGRRMGVLAGYVRQNTPGFL